MDILLVAGSIDWGNKLGKKTTIKIPQKNPHQQQQQKIVLNHL